MRPEIKRLYSTEVELDEWEPDTLADVYFLAEMEIGEVDDERRDMFYVKVATPEGLRANATNAVIADRGVLVVSAYSLPELREHLSKLLLRCEGSTWSDVAAKLQRYFVWEYEDYVEE